MAAIQCPKCKNIIPDTVESCPACGCPMQVIKAVMQRQAMQQQNMQKPITPVVQPQSANTAVQSQPVKPIIQPQIVQQINASGDAEAEQKSEQNSEVQKQEKKKRKFTVNIPSIVSLLLGIAIIVLGVSVMNMKTEITIYKDESASNGSQRNYDIQGASFGADFYTYMYDAADTIVDELDTVTEELDTTIDELNDVNKGIETLSQGMSDMANAIYYPAGIIVIAIGMGVIAMSCNHILKKES